jgi:hypothetical protein
MGDDLEDAIRTNAEGPASASDETGGVQQHSLADQIAADRYAKGIVLTLANDVVGTGPRLQMLARDPAVNQAVERAFSRSVGLRRVRGRQFRYCHFLCGHGLRKRLLRESPFRWGQEYPKKDDCVWTLEGGGETRAAEGSRAIREPPRFQGSGQFRDAAPLFAQAEAEETPRQDAPGRLGEAG